MDEVLVLEKVPEIYSSILKLAGPPIDWAQIKTDLESLNWLEDDPIKENEIVNAAWNVVDRWAIDQLDQKPRLLITKVNKVKLFIFDLVFKLSLNKDLVKNICTECKLALTHLIFFKKAKSLLNIDQEGPDEAMVGTLQSIENTYKEMKQVYHTLFLHVDKHFTSELRHTISELLDEQFKLNIIQPFKERLLSIPLCSHILNLYDKSATPVYMGYHSYVQREQVYLGELDAERRRNGYGKMNYSNGDVYEGYWLNDKPHGKGLYLWKEYGSYEGDFKEGAMTGKGVRVFKSGNNYTGDFVHNKKQGQGTMVFTNGDVYEGEWDNDSMHGNGKYTWSSEDYYIGGFVRDKRSGNGTLTLAGGEVIEGEWRDGVMVPRENSS